MTPYSHRASCAVCRAELNLSAIRDHEPRTKTAFAVPCPVCQSDVHGVIPLSITLATLQVVSFERPTKPKVKRHAA